MLKFTVDAHWTVTLPAGVAVTVNVPVPVKTPWSLGVVMTAIWISEVETNNAASGIWFNDTKL